MLESMNKKSVYLAGPLFTAAEVKFNLHLSDILKDHGYKVFLPQHECLNKVEKDIFTTCRNGIESANMILAILDGADADSGTCWECGYAVAKGKPVILVRTDIRHSGDTKGFNAMLYYSASAVIEERENYVQEILDAIEKV